MGPFNHLRCRDPSVSSDYGGDWGVRLAYLAVSHGLYRTEGLNEVKQLSLNCARDIPLKTTMKDNL